MTDLFTLADCDRHDRLRANEPPSQPPLFDDARQCETIRALTSELSEQVKRCGECGGTGIEQFASESKNCPWCKSARDLLAKMGVKL